MHITKYYPAMVPSGPVIDFLAERDTIDAVKDWQRWLLVERQLSKNTLAAYSHDLKAFFDFLSNHLSENKIARPVSLKDLDTLAVTDFRSFLFYRVNPHNEDNQSVEHSTNARKHSWNTLRNNKNRSDADEE